MTARLLLIMAAVALSSCGVSAAQDMKQDEMPARAPSVQQRAPAENVALPARPSVRKTSETTGQGATIGFASLSTAQRIMIDRIIRQQKVEPAKLNVSLWVGAKVPPSVPLNPLPVEVTGIYPGWSGYDYVMVGEKVLVIDPGTYEIIAIIGV